ncbi:CmcJ/NvfI family oxidoreductase [Streptomyces sp. A30]|uniref:CmcJ/NvfI family oxidoreductase n=1 Tax=Streptomyces sp. A30 TaxID=2789273 RepID=UPI003980F2A8
MPRHLDATILHYDAPEPALECEPDFLSVPLTGKPVRIEDMRGRTEEFSLDRQGFTTLEWPTEIKDFYDRDEVLRKYVPELDKLVRGLTGCSATQLLNSPVVRMSDRAGDIQAGAVGTGSRAHADYSHSCVESQLRRMLPPEEADARLKKRYSIFNVWRAFSAPPQDIPLALCDPRTVAPEDKQLCAVTGKLGSGETVSWESMVYQYNERHRWYYCSDMTRDEVHVFRSFDSDPDRAEQIPHSAFVDETCPGNVHPRESVEVRMFAFYDD